MDFKINEEGNITCPQCQSTHFDYYVSGTETRQFNVNYLESENVEFNLEDDLMNNALCHDCGYSIPSTKLDCAIDSLTQQYKDISTDLELTEEQKKKLYSHLFYSIDY